MNQSGSKVLGEDFQGDFVRKLHEVFWLLRLGSALFFPLNHPNFSLELLRFRLRHQPLLDCR